MKKKVNKEEFVSDFHETFVKTHANKKKIPAKKVKAKVNKAVVDIDNNTFQRNHGESEYDAGESYYG